MSDRTSDDQSDVLLVEDNPGDVRLTKEAFRERKNERERESEREGESETRLHVATDGAEALDFLHQRGEYTDAPRPDIVLLDLNLPGTDGGELLTEIRGDPNLKTIPVIILTSSEAEEDVTTSYEHGANAYLTKPVDPGEFIDVVETVQKFWLSVARLPPKCRE